MSVISIMPRMNRHTFVIIAIDQFVWNAFNCLSPIVVTTGHPVIRCFSSRGALRRHQRQLLVLQAGPTAIISLGHTAIGRNMQWVVREHPIGLLLSGVRHQAFAKALSRKQETSCSEFFSSIKFH